MGYAFDRFISQSDLEAFKCSVCSEVVKDPKKLGCDHMVCNLCLQNLDDDYSEGLQCNQCLKIVKIDEAVDPPRMFLNFYSPKELRCVFDACSTVCRILEIDKHEEDCIHNPVNVVFCESCKFSYSNIP